MEARVRPTACAPLRRRSGLDLSAKFGSDRAASFGGTADLYERARPGYPPDLLDALVRECGLQPTARLLDLGAGTGKLTRQLLQYGSVTAVEPSPEMRAQLERVVAGARSLDGTAESVPLPDASVDAVFVGQAYHWFNQPVANPEIARVLVDGGHLIALWNHESRVPWVVAAEAVMGRGAAPTDAGDHRRTWASRFHHAPWFTAPLLRAGSMTVSTTKSELLARCESYSAVSVLTPDERVPILAQIAEIVADFPDPFDVEYETEAYWCRKLPLPAS